MNHIRRTFGVLPVVALVLAACAAPGTGGGDTQSPIPSASVTDDGTTDGVDRINIGDVYADPASFAGQTVRILGRVDSLLVEDAAFLTSPSGEEDGLLVVVSQDASVDKAPAERGVVWITGTVVPMTADDLATAGALVSADDPAVADVTGEYAIVASELGDPFASE